MSNNKHCPLNFTTVKAHPCAMHAWFHHKVHQMSMKVFAKINKKKLPQYDVWK